MDPEGIMLSGISQRRNNTNMISVTDFLREKMQYEKASHHLFFNALFRWARRITEKEGPQSRERVMK